MVETLNTYVYTLSEHPVKSEESFKTFKHVKFVLVSIFSIASSVKQEKNKKTNIFSSISDFLFTNPPINVL